MLLTVLLLSPCGVPFRMQQALAEDIVSAAHNYSLPWANSLILGNSHAVLMVEQC